MSVKAIMCDVDGTLLGKKGFVTERTVNAIREARAEGYLFGLCTGRDVHSVKDLLKSWHIDGMVDAIVGTGGAEICDLTKGIEQQSYPLNGEYIREIMSHYSGMNVNFAIPWQGKLYAPKEDMFIKLLSKADHIPYQVIDYDQFLKEPRPKLMIICNPLLMNKVIERAAAIHSDQYKSAALKTASILYEFMDPRISKTHGLQQIMELHGWAMENLLSFGDEDNDIDMLLNSGIGVAMANGSEKAKKAADAVTGDCNHDGIAEYLEEHLLKKHS